MDKKFWLFLSPIRPSAKQQSNPSCSLLPNDESLQLCIGEGPQGRLGSPSHGNEQQMRCQAAESQPTVSSHTEGLLGIEVVGTISNFLVSPHFFLLFLFIHLFLAMLGLHCYMGFSLVAASRGYSLDVVCWLLIAVASLVAEHRL